MQLSHWQTFFEHLFFFLVDVFFLALEIAAIRIVRQTKWQVHTKWLEYFIAQSVLMLLHRLIWYTHFFTGIHLPTAAYMLARAFSYIADITGIYGTYVLYRRSSRWSLKRHKNK